MPEIICTSCFNCGSANLEAIERVESTTINGVKLHYMAEHYRCTSCGNLMDTPNQYQRNLDTIKSKLSERNINVRID